MTFRHLKTGADYEIVDVAQLSSNGPVGDGDEVVIYRGTNDGRLWVRPAAEFYDGRFVPLGDQEK